nr:glucose-6-phosphate dehydrogenase assembly protein OpcA [Pseudoclavibacter chungangensis]
MQDTTTSAVAKRLLSVREEGGVVALGRVLTLVIMTTKRMHEAAVSAANAASGEHPMRVIVVDVVAPDSERARVDAEIRVGGDAGASDVVVLHVSGAAAADTETLVQALLLPDAPVVAWWPDEVLGSPASSSLGRIAQLRISDSRDEQDPVAALERLGDGFEPGDSDLAWTRLTMWRAQLAAVLDQPPFEPVLSVEVVGRADSSSAVLMAAWLELALRVPVTLQHSEDGSRNRTSGLQTVRLVRESGTIELDRVADSTVRLTQPGQPEQYIPMPVRDLTDVLTEELRSLAPDRIYGEVLQRGVPELCRERAE